jgi:membrane associated rhomboid family serine protease
MKPTPTITILTLIIAICYISGVYTPLSAQSEWWTYLTYSASHNSIFHFIGNLVAIYTVGVQIERSFGWKHTAALILLSSITGGVGYVLTSQGEVVGASAIAVGLLTMWALMEPMGKVKLFGRRAYVLIGILSFDVFMFTTGSQAIAHASHLSAAVFVYAYRTFFKEYYAWRVKMRGKQAYENALNRIKARSGV